MVTFLHGIGIAWIWAKNNPNDSLEKTLEEALTKFRQKFDREPAFLIVNPGEQIDGQNVFGLETYSRQYVLKHTLLLGVERDTTSTSLSTVTNPDTNPDNQNLSVSGPEVPG